MDSGELPVHTATNVNSRDHGESLATIVALNPANVTERENLGIAVRRFNQPLRIFPD